MEWMILPLRRYADFQGRSRRMEYWMFALGIFIVYLAIALFTVPFFSMGADGNGWAAAYGVLGLFSLAILIPSVAVQVRRFHDQDRSGWFVLLNLIPYVGGLIVFVFMCLEGTKGANRFGPDPTI